MVRNGNAVAFTFATLCVPNERRTFCVCSSGLEYYLRTGGFRLCKRNTSNCFSAVSIHQHATSRADVRNAVCMKIRASVQTVDPRRMQRNPQQRESGLAGSKALAVLLAVQLAV
jgi:hypothetical protein